jgi:hypothetical protein
MPVMAKQGKGSTLTAEEDEDADEAEEDEEEGVRGGAKKSELLMQCSGPRA